jgi:hypothetical protein
MAAARSKKYVIQRTTVGGFSQGEVVEAERFVVADPKGKGEDYDAAPRLLARGAIREATDAEAGLARVETTGTLGLPLSTAAALALGEKDAELERLRRLAGDQRDKLASLERLGMAAAEGTATAGLDAPEVQSLLEQKDKELEALKKQTEEEGKRLEAAEKEATKKNEETAKEAQKAREQALKGGGSPRDHGTHKPATPHDKDHGKK